MSRGTLPPCEARWHGVHMWMARGPIDVCTRCEMEAVPELRGAVHEPCGGQSYDDDMAAAETLVPETLFTAEDRCDRCGAQAQMRAQFANGVLLFCGHHGRVHASAIASQVHVPRRL